MGKILVNPLWASDKVSDNRMTYPVKAISADALDLTEIESGTARRVAAQASRETHRRREPVQRSLRQDRSSYCVKEWRRRRRKELAQSQECEQGELLGTGCDGLHFWF